MALRANRITGLIAVTGHTIFQIHSRSATMTAAGFCIGPAGRSVRPRHHQFSAMAIDTNLTVLMTAVTGLFVDTCLNTVGHPKIARMNLTIEIIALVAIQTLMVAMAQFAVILSR